MPTETAELELAPPQAGEAPMKQLAPFDAFRAQAEKLKVTAETLTVTDINDRAGMQLARTTRLALKEVRVAVTHRHTELKAGILAEGQKLDAGKRELLALIEPLESRLKDQEEFIERELARIAEEKRAARIAELTPFLSAPLAIDLGNMTDEAYAATLADAKDAHASKLAREQKEKEEAAAKLQAEAEAREAQRLENIRLQKLADDLAEAARKEREAAAAALAKEREEAARLAREAQAKADAEAKKLREEAAERERVAAEKAKAEAEKARKEREAIEAKAKADREALEKIEAEIAAQKRAAEEEAAAKLSAAKFAAAAPDKEKLTALAKTIRELPLPTLSTEEGAGVMVEITAQIEKMAAWVGKKAAAL